MEKLVQSRRTLGSVSADLFDLVAAPMDGQYQNGGALSHPKALTAERPDQREIPPAQYGRATVVDNLTTNLGVELWVKLVSNPERVLAEFCRSQRQKLLATTRKTCNRDVFNHVTVERTLTSLGRYIKTS